MIANVYAGKLAIHCRRYKLVGVQLTRLTLLRQCERGDRHLSRWARDTFENAHVSTNRVVETWPGEIRIGAGESGLEIDSTEYAII